MNPIPRRIRMYYLVELLLRKIKTAKNPALALKRYNHMAKQLKLDNQVEDFSGYLIGGHAVKIKQERKSA